MTRTCVLVSVALTLAACSKSPTRVVAAAVSRTHSCAALDDGTVWCWGQNERGELGDGTTTNRPTPVRVKGLEEATDVAVGEDLSCAVKRSGQVVCWGGGATNAVPAAVEGMADAIKVATSGGVEMCAIRRSHVLACWQPGQPATDTSITDAADFVGQGLVRALNGRIISGRGMFGETEYHPATMREGQGNTFAAGWFCVLETDGQIACTRRGDSEPLPVDGVQGARGIALLLGSGCAYDGGGAVTCWAASNDVTQVQRVRDAGPVTAFAEMSGQHMHVCAIRRDGRLACWADNVRTIASLGVASRPAPFEVVFPALPLPQGGTRP